MIQVHFWSPKVIDTAQWVNKINISLDALLPAFEHLELGHVQTHFRNSAFSADQLAPMLEEVLFYPIVRQLHIIVLTEYDVLPLDSLRLIDELIHLDSIARLTRRVQILVFDSLTKIPTALKIPTPNIKEGILSVSNVSNTRIFVADTDRFPHDASFDNCSNCDALIRLSFIVIILRLHADTYPELSTSP
jgi:hypothetical protein